ncbi:MAG: hypothetical protein AAF086_02045 [Planctomycetota bacterium]
MKSGTDQINSCELCGRSGLELTKHHLIPRARHNKPRTRRLYPDLDLHTHVAHLCRPCHATVHHQLSEQELAEAYPTLDALRRHPGIAKFARWAAKQPADRRVATKRPASRR